MAKAKQAENNKRVKKGNVYEERGTKRRVRVVEYTSKAMSRVVVENVSTSKRSEMDTARLRAEPWKLVKAVAVRHYPKQPTRAERAKKIARTKKPKRALAAR